MGNGLIRKQNCFSLDKNGLDQCEGGEKQSQQALLTEYKREERDVKDNFFKKFWQKENELEKLWEQSISGERGSFFGHVKF